MGAAPRKGPRWVAGFFGALLLLALLGGAGVWWRIRASLPALDGTASLPGLSAAAKIERDALGTPTITGATRADVARATGFVHAQDRFFQMDLLRRTGAGELAELFGAAAVSLDQGHRRHGFRRLATQVLAGLPAEKRALLDAYTAGVNAGLAGLTHAPWEYAVLRTDPRPWRAEDSLLVIYAMWFDLQDSSGSLELSLEALRDALGQAAVDFLAPRGTSWDSALDGSSFPVAPPPGLDFRPPAPPAPAANDPTPSGSNAFAVAGRHAGGGAALLASDMHLNLRVPHVWYRAALAWTDAAGKAHRLDGVTLPGVPALVSGSNGRIAWGFTVAYADTSDVVVVETDKTSPAFYRTAAGYKEVERRSDPIFVKGGAPVPFAAHWTEWGPLLGPASAPQFRVLRWNAHDADATNLEVMDLETAATVDEAVAIAHRSGVPNLNLVVTDASGGIAWTLAGKIPRRVGYDGRFPVSWSYGDRRWDGWLSAGETPAIINPPDGILWSANQRMVGGEAYARLGDGGYYGGARGGQLRDGLRSLVTTGKPVVPTDLLALQLDNRALFFERWQKLLLGTLGENERWEETSRRELAKAVSHWEGRADPGSASYRLVYLWRLKVAERALAPFFAQAATHYPGFNSGNLQYEDALWQLVREQPARLLNPEHESWHALLLAAVDDVIAETNQAGVSPDRLTQGRANTLRMQHPFSRLLPGFLHGFLDMPAEPIPGGSHMPRLQTASFGASDRLVVAPGRESEGIFHMPGGPSGNPLSPFYRSGHDAWVKGAPTPLRPGPTQHVLNLVP
jgi:penicillin amidase